MTPSHSVGFWLMVGFISFGVPAGPIAVTYREPVEQKRWISEQRFLHALNDCGLLPGPEAQQIATCIGWLLHRTWAAGSPGCRSPSSFWWLRHWSWWRLLRWL